MWNLWQTEEVVSPAGRGGGHPCRQGVMGTLACCHMILQRDADAVPEAGKEHHCDSCQGGTHIYAQDLPGLTVRI